MSEPIPPAEPGKLPPLVPQISAADFPVLSDAELRAFELSRNALMREAAKRMAAQIEKVATLMLCDGRARDGWAIVVCWASPDPSENLSVTEVAPGEPLAYHPGAKVEVIHLGDMLHPQSPFE